jgi:hypothetical protein
MAKKKLKSFQVATNKKGGMKIEALPVRPESIEQIPEPVPIMFGEPAQGITHDRQINYYQTKSPTGKPKKSEWLISNGFGDRPNSHNATTAWEEYKENLIEQ